MDEQIQNMVNDIQEQFQLNNYFLKRYHIFHEKRSLTEGNYILNMEWFPNQPKEQQEDEDLNPKGTVSIDIDFHSKELYRIIFVGGISNPDAKDIFPTTDKADVIHWVEETTGLIFGKQFKIESEKGNTFYFRAAIDNINAAPGGMIHVEFNEKDELTLFSIDGLFPTEDKVVWEPFSLLPENMGNFFKEQLQLVEVPVEEDEKWMPVYMIEELYVKNDGEVTLPYDSLNKDIMNIKLEWSAPLQGPFNPKEEMDLSTEVTVDQAVANNPHPDNIPLSDHEKEAAINGARDFLRQKFPEESGEWLLHSIYRNSGYIVCELKPIQKTTRAFSRKIKVIMDQNTLEVINYIDNKIILEMFAEYKEANEVSITQGKAYEKLKNYFKVSPTYVYHRDEDMYYLYGKIDSKYGVIATTGEIVHLDNL